MSARGTGCKIDPPDDFAIPTRVGSMTKRMERAGFVRRPDSWGTSEDHKVVSYALCFDRRGDWVYFFWSGTRDDDGVGKLKAGDCIINLAKWARVRKHTDALDELDPAGISEKKRAKLAAERERTGAAPGLTPSQLAFRTLREHLGAEVIGMTIELPDGTRDYVAPVPATKEELRRHIDTVHGTPGLGLDEHDGTHRTGVWHARTHRHV